MRADYPPARLSSVTPRELNGVKFVAFVKGLVIRRVVDRFLREQGVVVHTAAQFDTIENIKEGVKVGAGVSLLPAPTIRLEVRAGTLKGVPLAGCRLLAIGVIRRRRHKSSLSNSLNYSAKSATTTASISHPGRNATATPIPQTANRRLPSGNANRTHEHAPPQARSLRPSIRA